jgi:salicylate hydroxylase
LEVFGDGAHLIAIPVSEDVMGWACVLNLPLFYTLYLSYPCRFRVTQREAETKETWRQMDAAAVAAFKKTPMTQWSFDFGDLIKNGYDVIKVHISFFLSV